MPWPPPRRRVLSPSGSLEGHAAAAAVAAVASDLDLVACALRTRCMIRSARCALQNSATESPPCPSKRQNMCRTPKGQPCVIVASTTQENLESFAVLCWCHYSKALDRGCIVVVRVCLKNGAIYCGDGSRNAHCLQVRSSILDRASLNGERVVKNPPSGSPQPVFCDALHYLDDFGEFDALTRLIVGPVCRTFVKL